jgi:hypothetical protein
MHTLYEIIKAQLSEKIKNAFDLRRVQADGLNVVVLAGNGLTRLAGYTFGVGDSSWRDCVNNAWTEASPARGTFAALERQGKSLPAIFDLIVHNWASTHGVGGQRIWEPFWNAVQHVELKQLAWKDPSLHLAVLNCCSDVITTNYDRMFEAAYAAVGETGLRYWMPSVLRSGPGQATFLQENEKADRDLRKLYKIHGSFSEPDSWNDGELRKAILDFEGWFEKQQEAGKEGAVATGRAYEKIAFHLTNTEFGKCYEEVLDLMSTDENVIVCVGLGLGAEEHIISRLLSSRRTPHAPILKFNIAMPLELDPGELKGIDGINLDIGLAASPERRYIATACFLECVFRITGSRASAERFQRLATSIERPGSSAIWPNKVTVANAKPLALAFGQTSINRVIGIFEPPTQEQSFQANRASLSPLPNDREQCKEMHTPAELGGQSTVPCLIWDALGMPSMLVSSVGDDALGDFVLRELSKTLYLNFDQVPQSMAATDSLTVATWYGLRSIFENARQIREVSYSSEWFNQERIGESMSGAQLIYLTKVGYDDWKNRARYFGSSLVLFDTGGGACPEQARAIGGIGGIVVASALAAAGEQLYDDLRNWGNASEFWFTRPSGEKKVVPAEWNSSVTTRDFPFSEMKKWKDIMLPNNDTGREHQTLWFLNVLARQNLIPTYLREHYPKCPAFVVTLGEYGIVYWVREDSGWKGPWRVWCDALPLHEIRSGLECGDCTRGGIGAALVARLLINPELKAADFHAAFKFGAWCGTTKLRFFSLVAYREALRQRAEKLLLGVLSGSSDCLEDDDVLKLPVQSAEMNTENLQQLIARAKSEMEEGKMRENKHKWAEARSKCS